MRRHDAISEAEHLVNLHQTVWDSAQTVYKVTERLVDEWPDETRNPDVDSYVNFAYDELLKADRLIDIQAETSAIFEGIPNAIWPVGGFWWQSRMGSVPMTKGKDWTTTCVSFAYRIRLGYWLANLTAREAIDGMLDIYPSRDILFRHLDRNHHTQELTNNEIRVLDGIIELSVEYVETIAGRSAAVNTDSVPPRFNCTPNIAVSWSTVNLDETFAIKLR